MWLVQCISIYVMQDTYQQLTLVVCYLSIVFSRPLFVWSIFYLSLGKSDPYCLIEYQKNKWQSKTIRKTINPLWDEYFEFNVMDSADKVISFTIMDWDMLTSDGTAITKIKQKHRKPLLLLNFVFFYRNTWVHNSRFYRVCAQQIPRLVASFAQETKVGWRASCRSNFCSNNK